MRNGLVLVVDRQAAIVTARCGEHRQPGVQGEPVPLLRASSANRDERQFANPDRLDITREPNKHLAFGLGAHFCLGAPLARLEGHIAINTLLRRAPDLRLTVAPEALRWRRGLLLRGLEALPVAFDKDARDSVGRTSPRLEPAQMRSTT